MEIQELISLAQKALETDIKSDNFLVALEDYSHAFDRWFLINREKLSNISDIDYQAQVDLLVELHEKIVDTVSDEKAEHPEAIKKLKQKGKGIMAYTDLLPKRISIRMPRKG